MSKVRIKNNINKLLVIINKIENTGVVVFRVYMKFKMNIFFYINM